MLLWAMPALPGTLPWVVATPCIYWPNTELATALSCHAACLPRCPALCWVIGGTHDWYVGAERVTGAFLGRAKPSVAPAGYASLYKQQRNI